MTGPLVVPVTGVRARMLPGASPVETCNAAAIEAAWRAALAMKPKMFNGRILLGETAEIRDGVLDVAFREASFATLIWLRSEGGQDEGLLNVFGAAAVVSRDGAALLGRMAPHNSTAGQVYFPCGTPDLEDVKGGEVDLEGSIARELEEESGLAAPVVRPTERSLAVFDGVLLGFIRRFETNLDAEELAARAEAHLAGEAVPELDGIVMARSASELGPETPPYARAALSALLGVC